MPVDDEGWGLERRLIDAVAGVASGGELRQTLLTLVSSAVDMLDAEYGALGIRDDAGGLTDFLYVGITETEAQRIGSLPVGRGVLGLIQDQDAPVIVDDISKHEHSVGFPPGHPPMRTFIGTAVRTRGRAFGNLYLTGKKGGGSFDANDARTLNAFAGAAGLAVENARLFELSSRKEQWLRAGTEVTTAILSGADTDEVLGLVARRVKDCARADGVALMLADESGDMVIEIAAGDAAAEMTGLRTDETWLNSMQATQTGRPILIEDLAATGTFEHEVFNRLGPCLVLPLLAADRSLGAIAVGNYRGGRMWDDTDIALGEAFASQTALALVLAESQREQERLAVYVDRDRIARDLHDLVIQRLFAVGMSLQGAQRRGEVPETFSDRIDAVVADLDETVREIRQTIFALSHLDDGGVELVPPLRSRVLREVAIAGSTLGFSPHVHFDGAVDAVVPDDVADHVVAALREGLSNAVRHAYASAIDVQVRLDGADVVVEVEDDGVGVFPGGRRSGLENLEKRASSLGGSSTSVATRSDGSGNRLVWRAPVREEEP